MSKPDLFGIDTLLGEAEAETSSFGEDSTVEAEADALLGGAPRAESFGDEDAELDQVVAEAEGYGESPPGFDPVGSSPISSTPVVLMQPQYAGKLSNDIQRAAGPMGKLESDLPGALDNLTGESNDILKMILHTHGFENWATMGDEIARESILDTAIGCAIFGQRIDAAYGAYQAFEDTMQSSGLIAKMKTAVAESFENAAVLYKSDILPALEAALPGSGEQDFNQLALSFWLGHKLDVSVGPIETDRYPQLSSLLTMAWSAGWFSDPHANVPSDPSADGPGTYTPEQVEPDSGYDIPRPQLIVAVGTALTIGAALLKG